jgi:hypothetical protein
MIGRFNFAPFRQIGSHMKSYTYDIPTREKNCSTDIVYGTGSCSHEHDGTHEI